MPVFSIACAGPVCLTPLPSHCARACVLGFCAARTLALPLLISPRQSLRELGPGCTGTGGAVAGAGFARCFCRLVGLS